MAKPKLSFPLSLLATLSVNVLAAIYTEAAGKEPGKSSDTTEKILQDLLAIADPAPEPAAANVPGAKSDLPEFTFNKKKYKALMPRVDIPGIGVRTAAELAVDSKAVEHLIRIGCVGTVIAEV